MTTDLRTIFPDMEQSANSLDWFISCRLFAAGAWDSPRVSDGVHRVRILERTPSRLRLGGWIWEISQALKPFWLDVEVAGESIQWALYFDLDLPPRALRNAIDLYDRSDALDWRVETRGIGVLADGEFHHPWPG